MSIDIKNQLPEKLMQRVHSNVLKVLKNIGVEVKHSWTQNTLREHKGIRISGDRAYFSEEIIEETINKLKIEQDSKLPQNNTKGKFAMITGYSCSYILEDGTDVIRQPVTSDLIRMTKLADYLGFNGSAPVAATDIQDNRLMEVAMYKTCWQNSRYINGAALSSKEAVDYVFEMSKVVEKPLVLPLYPINPLKINPECLEMIRYFLERGIPFSVADANIPILGMNAPFPVEAAIVQTVAESLAVCTVMRLLTGKIPDMFLVLNSLDVKNLTMGIGTPFYQYLKTIEIGVLKWYGVKNITVNCGSMSKGFDIQAAIERTIGFMIAAMCGATGMCMAGKTQSEFQSAELMLLDSEINCYINSLTGYNDLEFEKSFDLIKEVINDGTDYITHETTLERFRGVIWESELFDYSSIQQWLMKSKQSFRERAVNAINGIIQKHRFVIEEDKVIELEKIYNLARNKFSK